MASQVCESLAFINDSEDGVSEMEVLEINGAFLMSLMEESPSDENDDDRLDSLIKSFEAEITGSRNMEGHDSASTGSKILVSKDAQSWNMDGQDCWASSSEFGVEWVDMDMMPSSPCDDRSWFVDPYGYGDGMDNKVFDGVAMGEHGFNSLWQDSYNLVR